MSEIKIKGFSENVEVPVQVDLQGFDKPVKFSVVYKRLDKPALEQISKEATDRSLKGRDLNAQKLDATPEKREELDEEIKKLELEANKVVSDRVVGWKKFFDEDGQEIPFSQETLELVLEHPAYARAIDAGFWKATGERVKN